jgi:hypothetical protein
VDVRISSADDADELKILQGFANLTTAHGWQRLRRQRSSWLAVCRDARCRYLAGVGSTMLLYSSLRS